MCNTCGCGAGQARLDGQDISEHRHPHEHGHSHGPDGGHVHPQAHEHVHADGTRHVHTHSHDHGHDDHDHEHGHEHDHDDGHDHGHIHDRGADLHYGKGPAHAHAPGMSQARMVQIERDILSKNDEYARANRSLLQGRGVFALNLVSSPGAGKTTLLVRTIEALRSTLPLAVIEGDQQTSNDADRIRATGVAAVQVNTGKGCHLDAHMVGHALERLTPAEGSVLFIENVGNLVCPAAFDLGEAHKVVILSTTEGEDKPAKYPDMFRAASVMLLNKCDLLPHLRFDVQAAVDCALRVNPRLQVMRVSAYSGEGMDAWLAWLRAGLARALAQRADEIAHLRQRVAELESKLAAG